MKTVLLIITTLAGAFIASAEPVDYLATPMGKIWTAAILSMEGQVTNTPAPPPAPTNITAGSLPGGLGQLAGDFYNFFTDAQPYFGTNKTIRFVVDALNTGNNWGGFAEGYIPITANGQASIGFGLGYLKGGIYDAATSLNWGTTWTIPLINQQIYTFVESGPCYNFKLKEPAEQSFAGLAYNTHWFPGQLAFNAVFGNISDLNQPVRGGGVSYSVKF